METVLVVASGPGRETGLRQCLESVLRHPQGPLCERAFVGWPAASAPPGDLVALFQEATFTSEFGLRTLFATAWEQARLNGYSFWLFDDERVVAPPGAPPVARPLTRDLELLRPAGISIQVLHKTHVGVEARITAGQATLPAWMRPSLRLDAYPLVGHPVLAGIAIQRQRFRASALRLNLGAGSRNFSGWLSVDHDTTDDPDVLLDLTSGPLPFKDQTVEAIYFSHALDHLDAVQGQAVLAECRRVLVPGGPIRVAVCDLGAFIRKYQDGTLGDYAYFQPGFAGWQSRGALFGIVGCGALSGKAGAYGGHRMLYDQEALCEALTKAGFRDVHGCAENEHHPAFYDVDDVFPDHSAYASGIA